MDATKQAAFTFENLRFVDFSLKEVDGSQQKISLDLNPSGVYNKTSGVYILKLRFEALINVEAKSPFITSTIIADFKFTPSEEFELPDYFFLNSIAIIYPYLRSFISSLTLQANIKPLTLPIMNLTSLQQPLKDNTIIIGDEEGN